MESLKKGGSKKISLNNLSKYLSIFGKRNFLLSICFFILINIFLYCFIYLFSNSVKFEYRNYEINSHHYFHDERFNNGEFNFLRSIGQYDAQWYLKIAEKGYPKNPYNININEKYILDGLSYAFFPLYPLTISILNYLVGNIEITAFIFANFLMIANFLSLFFVISKFYKPNIAIKTIFLMFLFPFSIFYRSYFTEGLFLLEIIWFSYYLINKKYLPASILAGILSVTRGTGIFLIPVLVYFIYENFTNKKALINSKMLLYFLMMLLPITAWSIFTFLNTGNALYFICRIIFR